jgi:hypothetical protein
MFGLNQFRNCEAIQEQQLFSHDPNILTNLDRTEYNSIDKSPGILFSTD